MEIDHSSQVGDEMDYTTNSPFVKSLMTGLAIGVSDTILSLLFNLFYRHDATSGYFSSDYVSVSSIIFGINILFVVIGLLFAAVQGGGRLAEWVFSLVFLVLTIVGVIAAMGVHPWADPLQNNRFHGLLAGLVIIVGVSAALLPVIYHNRKFRQYVL
ncbi:MAG TPA: hypothetical protein VKU83_06835 [Puia sp.]|nr:hypothetical protein [Puia sp.]